MLSLTEKGQLAEISAHCSDHGGETAGPEGEDAFVAGYAGEGVEDGFVMCSLGWWLESVGLHAYECYFGGVADEAA